MSARNTARRSSFIPRHRKQRHANRRRGSRRRSGSAARSSQRSSRQPPSIAPRTITSNISKSAASLPVTSIAAETAHCYQGYRAAQLPLCCAAMSDDPKTRATITLLPGHQKRAEGGHPWIYSNEIAMDAATKALPAGGLVTIRKADGKGLGVATFNPHPLVSARLLSRDATQKIDRTFLTRAMRRALALRERLFTEPCYRLVHAEADGLPGLIVDRFSKALVCQFNTAGMALLEADVLAALDQVLDPEIVVLRNDSPARLAEGLPTEIRVAKGSIDAPVELVENGVRFRADLLGGQKTGWFFDQRANRRFMAGLARGGRVLDLYTFAGGFAVQAAVAGGREVVGIDRSEPALALAKEAAILNGVVERCIFRRAEVFAELERLAQEGERFDVVIA